MVADIEMLAACGLDCGSCVIRRLPLDDEGAEACVAWFRKMEWLTADEGREEAIERGMYCQGCLGDRAIHWSVDEDSVCWILECCVDQRGLQNCAHCQEFPCDRLVDWASGDNAYATALERLRGIAASNA
jgi:hypothetical protein